MEARKPSFSEEQFALYTRYLRQRHAGGGMDEPEEHQYLDFLTAAWCDTRFLEFRLDSRLVAVAVTDVLDDALSAVYTFFDPDLAGRGLGRYAVLRQIARARTEGRRWLYLGYWIAESPKMAYKGQYRPLERYTEGAWRRLPV